MIPLSIPNFEGNELKYVTDAVSQGWVSTGGAYVEKMEKTIAAYTNTEMAVACQSGTAALHLSLIQCGVDAGDIVLVPTLTFIAAVNPVKYLGAVPIFMDCDDSLCMDPDKLEDFCYNECVFSDGKLLHKETKKHVKALVVVHVFGNMADMVRILEICNKYHIKIIEDATEAIGTYYSDGALKGRMAGTIGDIGAYSFNGNKIITTGGGGMIVGRNVDELKHVKYLSTQAKDDEHFYIHNEVGYNYRMTNVQAAIGVAQMEELEEFIIRKNRNYDLYKSLLVDNKRMRLIGFREDIRSNKWFYSVFVQNSNKKIADIVNELQKKGVQTRPIWGLIHEQKPYTDCVAYKIEKAKYYSEHIINVPCSTNLQSKEIEEVVGVLEKVI